MLACSLRSPVRSEDLPINFTTSAAAQKGNVDKNVDVMVESPEAF